MDEQPIVDYSKLPAELRTKLTEWENNSPAGQQLASLKSVSEQLGAVVKLLGADGQSTQQLSTQLGDIHTVLETLNAKETPESPDFSQPIIDGLKRLEDSLTSALTAIEVTPQIDVKAPQVSVAAPNVSVAAPDLTGVERVLKTLPGIFQQAIANIPETPEPDLTPIVLQLTAMSDQLASIDVGTRLKPLPGSMSLTANGATISSANPLPITGSISAASAPTFKDDPTNGSETPKYGKTNSSTHKQQVEADTGLSQPLTDTQLRATPVPVSGSFTASGTQDENLKQVNGVTVNVGVGTASTGTQRVAVSSDSFPTTQAVSGTVTANAGTNLNTSALALESGGNLAAIKADVDKIPSQGQALAAASTPVVLPVAQITALTPPAAITNYANETGGNLATIAAKDFATQTTLALIKAKTDNVDVALSTRLKPADTLTKVTTVDTITNPVAVTGTFFQVTQPVSAAALPLPSGASTAGNQTTGNASLASIDTKLSGTLMTTGTTTELTGLMPKVFDYISANYSGSTADVYTYKAGGSGGTTAATLTVNWTDSTKTVLSTVVRT